MKKPDWSSVVSILTREAKAAIKDFAEEQPEDTVSYFGFDANPAYGQVLISIDTLDSSMDVSRRLNDAFLKEWRAKAKKPWTSSDIDWLAESHAMRVSD